MTISVTQFKARCLELIRLVEVDGRPVDIRRRGRIVARLLPARASGASGVKPWQRLRGSGRLLAGPGESVLEDGEFEALR
jgi:antitoxin (DNA-binding transcriptional repressor) of toxin-antitoxin stability system